MASENSDTIETEKSLFSHGSLISCRHILSRHTKIFQSFKGFST